MGGRSKASILYVLLQQERIRFSELRRACPPISDRILTHELKTLEQWNLIEREEFPVVPPKTDYRMSTYGKSLEPLMAAMAACTLQYADAVTR